MVEIVHELREQIASDHNRGCMGRQYSCTCGYDQLTDGLLRAAANEIERLRAALTRISNGGTAVLISATIDECPINPKVLEQIVKDALAVLPVSSTIRDTSDGIEGSQS